MKYIIILLSLLVSIPLFAQESLTNQSVLELQKMGFGKEVIIAKINNSPGTYDTSVEALLTLKESEVPSEVIAAMINNSKVEPETGIFYEISGEGRKKINPKAFTGRKTNTFSAAATYGIISNKSFAYLFGETSENRVERLKQVFEFQFAPGEENDPTSPNFLFMQATSPNDFALVKLFSNERKNHRGVKVGESGGVAGNQMGLQFDEIIDVAVLSEGNGKYKVRAKKPLEAGEYSFIYQGALPAGMNYVTNSVYDFTIVQE